MQNQDFDLEEYKSKLREDKIRKYNQIYNKLSMLDKRYKYSADTFMPYLFFFKYLAKRCYDESDKHMKLKMWIPDTIVMNDKDLPAMWFYSSADGYVYRTDSFTNRNAIDKFLEGSQHPNELIGVTKKPHFQNSELIGNDTKPFVNEDVKSLFQSLMASKGETAVIQRYIKSKGPKAYICRTIWKKNANPISWIITNKLSYNDPGDFTNRCIASSSKKFSCNITPCTGGRFVQETLPYVMNLLQFLRNTYNVDFEEIGCDFTKGLDNKWYFLNLRGYILSGSIAKIQTNHITHDEYKLIAVEQSIQQTSYYTKSVRCKFCQIVYPKHKLINKLTLKMIMETDNHLLNRNINIKWIKQRQQYTHIDIAMLFHQHLVCESCFQLYKACEQLEDIQFKLAQKLGIIVKEKNNLVSISQQDYRVKGPNVQLTDQSLTMPEYFEFPEEDEFQIEDQREKELKRFRILIYINKITDICLDVNANNKFILQYQFLDQTIRVPINIRSNYDSSTGSLFVQHTKLFYLFALDRSYLQSILDSIEFELYSEDSFLGSFNQDLKDFKYDKLIIGQFIRYFNGPMIHKALSWCTYLQIGLQESESKINVQRIKLTKFLTAYLPQQSYYCADPLPNDWVEVFQIKKDQSFTYFISDMSNILDNSRTQSANQKAKQRRYQSKSFLLDEINRYQKEYQYYLQRTSLI